MTEESARKPFLAGDAAEAAITLLNKRLLSVFEGFGVTELSATELQKFKGRSFLHGWSLPVLQVDGATILLLIDERFPFTSPRFALSPAPERLEYPHIEEDGVFCIDEEGQTSRSIDEPDIDALRVISEGVDLMEKLSDAVFCEKEFEREFLSYWPRMLTQKRKPTIYSILPLDMPSGEIVIWKQKDGKDETWLLAKDKDQATFWLKGFYGASGYFSKGKRFVKGYCLQSKEPPAPKKFPRTNKDISELEGFRSDETVRDFCRVFMHLPDSADVVLNYRTQNGFAPVVVSMNKGDARKEMGYVGDGRLARLVKEGKENNQVIAERYFEYAGELAISRMSVIRADHSWTHGRDQNKHSTVMQKKKVAYIGLGSVGSGLAKHLAQAGLGNGLLIDHQKLDFENTSRHQLGGFKIGKTKASGMYDYLARTFPHLMGYQIVEKKWEEAYKDDATIFHDCDLIIITTGGHGSGGAQLFLNRLSHTADLPPILYGWTEAFACAGHAVLLTGAEGCLECGFTGDSFNRAVTSWEGSTLSKVPACGQTFQPYGAIELENITTMIAKVAIDFLNGANANDVHRIWLGDTQLLTANGGKWSEAIQERAIKNNPGGALSLQGKWPQSATCTVCQKRKKENEISSAQQA